MKSLTATFVAMIGLGLCAAPLAFAKDDSFVGKWKFNPDKSKLNGLTYKVGDAGKDRVSFTFGDDTETVTLGKAHTTKYGNTWLISKTGPQSWRWVQKQNGKVTSDATWTVAGGGATSTYLETATRADGSTSHNTVKLKRTAGNGPGLVGTWQSTSIKIGSPAGMQITSWQGNGYSMMVPTNQSTLSFKLDGKDYTPTGPQVPKGVTVSAKAEGARAMALTYKHQGKTTETDNWHLSRDGKTLTDTIHFSGESMPEVDLYERE
jgi:hypothetical protein